MLVSIYMPTKNRLASLQLAVNSVLNQTYQNFELIVVDDASTDGTNDYLMQLTTADSRVKTIRNEVSKGACHARNLAIRSAQGDYLTGLDDDDEFEANHIGALFEYWNFLSNHSATPVSCIYTQAMMRNGNSLIETKKVNRVEYQDLFKANQVGNQIFAPRKHFIEAGLFDETMPAWQDLEFFFRVLKIFGTARLLDLPTYIFDVAPRPDRISVGQKAKIKKACERMTALHAAHDVRASQRLLLQVYAEHYGFPVTLSDCIGFAKREFWPRGYYILGRSIFRRYFPH